MAPKFNIGDEVEVYIERQHRSWRWTGKIVRIADATMEEGDGCELWEYTVENGPLLFGALPLLAWEPELTLLNPFKG